MPALDPRVRVERFVLRGRRVMAHSLVRDHLELLQQLANGTFNLQISVNHETGETTHVHRTELPPEEAFESLVARLRPFLMRDETVFWEVVLDAIEKLLSDETRNTVVDIDDLRAEWNRVTTGKRKAQAYYTMTENGHLTDFQLAEYWLNYHALHDKVITNAVGNDLSHNSLYKAAAEVYSRACACVDYTLSLIWHIRDMGLLELGDDVFESSLFADTLIEQPVVAYCAPAGSTPMPTDMSQLDLSAWKLVHDDPEVIGQLAEKVKCRNDRRR